MRIIFIIFTSIVLTGSSSSSAWAQQEFAAVSSMVKQINQRVRDTYRSLNERIRRNRQEARDARARQAAMKNQMALMEDMQRNSKARQQVTQQMLKDQMRHNKESQEGIIARQKEMQRLQKDRMRDLKEKYSHAH